MPPVSNSALDGGGVAQQDIGRGSGALQHAEDETGSRRLTTVAAQIVEHLVGEFAADQVALTNPTVDRVFRPGWVLEPPVLRIWRDVRRSDQQCGPVGRSACGPSRPRSPSGRTLGQDRSRPPRAPAFRPGRFLRSRRPRRRSWGSPAREEQAPPSAGPRQCGPMSPGAADSCYELTQLLRSTSRPPPWLDLV